MTLWQRRYRREMEKAAACLTPAQRRRFLTRGGTMTTDQFIDELLYLRYPKLRPEPAARPAVPPGTNVRHLTVVTPPRAVSLRPVR